MSQISGNKTYIYQQRYNSPVQYGRADSSQQFQNDSQSLQNTSDSVLTKAQSFQASQISEVKPAVESPYNLDIKV